MNDHGRGLFRKGLKRRSKEVRRMRVMTCLAVFFFVLVLLLQDNLGNFQMAQNYRKYGSWFCYSEGGFFNKFKYLEKSGECSVGSYVYKLYPQEYDENGQIINDVVPTAEDSTENNGDPVSPTNHIVVKDLGYYRSTYSVIGAYSPGMTEQYGITLYEGRFPEADNEIVMELSVLHDLGLSYELGQEVAFYVAERKPEPKESKAHEYVNGIEVIDEERLYLELDLVRFTLVGTLRAYTMTWSGGGNLPGSIISENAFKQLPCYRSKYVFYELTEALKSEKVWDFASYEFDYYEEKLSEMYPDSSYSGIPVTCCNTNAYTNPLWGSGKIYNYITVALLVTSTCILAYLMTMYLSSRKQALMQMREIGASVFDIWSITAYDCTISTLPYAALSIAAGYIAAAVAFSVLSKLDRLDFTFVFEIRTLLTVIAGTVAVLIIALSAAIVIFSGRKISGKKKSLSKSAERTLSRRAGHDRAVCRSYLGLKDVLCRRRMIHPLKTALVRLTCMIMGGLMLISFSKAFEYSYYYYRYRHSYSDLEGKLVDRVPHSGIDLVVLDTAPHWENGGRRKVETESVNIYRWATFFSYRNLLNESFFEELSKIPGVRSISRENYDVTHTLSWEGKWDDEFLDRCLTAGLYTRTSSLGYKVIYDGPHAEEMRRYLDGDYYMLLCSQNTRELWRKARPYLGKGADYSAFVRGEQVIVFVDQNCYIPQFVTQSGLTYDAVPMSEYAKTAENYWELSPSFASGDTVYIDSSKDSGASTPVKVAAVLPLTEFEYDAADNISEYTLPVFLTIGSMQLSDRVAEADGITPGANRFRLDFTSVEEGENSMKYISAICREYGAEYSDNIQFQRELKNDAIDKLLTYGFFSVIMAVMYLFIFSSIAREEDISLQPKYDVLHRLGSTWKEQRKQKSLDAAKQSLWQLLSVPACFAVDVVQSFSAYSKTVERGELSVHDYLQGFISGRVAALKSGFNEFPLILPAGLLCLVMLMILLWLIGRRYTPFNRNENHSDKL